VGINVKMFAGQTFRAKVSSQSVSYGFKAWDGSSFECEEVEGRWERRGESRGREEGGRETWRRGRRPRDHHLLPFLASFDCDFAGIEAP